MANQPLLREEEPPWPPQPIPGNNQSISGISASHNSNLLAGQFRDVYFGDSRKDLTDVLNSLPIAADAPFNVYYQQYNPVCLPDTRSDLLQDIDSWADGQDGQCIFWLSGLAGTGKSTIARTVARKYFDQKRLGASFFFSRGGGDVGHARKFVTSVAWQLVNSIPSLQHIICDAVKERRDIASLSLDDQWRQLILRPLSKLSACSGQRSYILVIDALDECETSEDIGTIVHLLSEAQSLKAARLRVFLTSRPEIPIRHGFQKLSDTKHQNFILHNVSPSIVDEDIRTFLNHGFKLIAQERSLVTGWPGQEIIKHLVYSASGLFIWAATAYRFIREGKRFVKKRLSIILENSSVSVNAAENHLDEIYITVLRNCISPEYSYEEVEELLLILKNLLGSIVTLVSPLSTQSLSKLLNTAQDEVNQTMDDLHSILSIPKDPTLPLRLHHPSFRDFLFEKTRCDEFWVDEKQAHQILADHCIRLMSALLKQDICGVNAPNMLVADAQRDWIERGLPPEVQYACRYWIDHVQKAGTQLCDNGKVHRFLQGHFLHWLEALGWMRKISDGVYAIAALESLVSSNDFPGLWSFLHDVKRFILYSRPGIEQAPLQTYSSALIFAPTSSIIRENFKACIPRWMQMLPKVEEKWNTVLQTLEGHTNWVTSVAFSPDGRTLASASWDETVKLCDFRSGALQQTLKGHFSWVNSVAFSPDGKTLALASGDTTVKLWDVGSGALQQTLKGHTDRVTSVAFSPDGRTLASASWDKTVKLWDVKSDALQQTLEGHIGQVTSVAFSPDGRMLASASWDETVKLWDFGSGALQQTLESHTGRVTSVAFSPDGRMLALASADTTVKLWDVGSGALQQTLKGHFSWVNSVAFSPDGRTLASASWDKTVKLWDVGSGALQQTLEGHTDRVTSVAFSPDGKTLASASGDKTVKLWDVRLDALQQTLEGHTDQVTSVAFSPDGRTLASASWDKTVKLWDVGSGALQQTLEGHTDQVTSVAFSPDGKTLTSASTDMTVKLWDVGSSALQQTLKGHSGRVTSVAFSPDSRTLASASADMTVKLWDFRLGALQQTLKSHTNWVTSVAFSPDSRMLASASWDETVKLWDVGSGALQQTLEGHSDEVNSVAFSPDGTSLQTDKGSIPISLPLLNGKAVWQQQPPPVILVEDQWVRCRTTPILWLPPEHRSHCIAVCERTVAFGFASGRVTIMGFAL
ncbi:hypothetical protein MMC25_007250 [Agyrium rufum]|nr:hypothetical protein [Agyrium rufum]